MIKFSLASDLHDMHWLDAGHGSLDVNFTNRERADVLILAGDQDENPTQSAQFVNRIADAYPHVVFTDGNHEHYMRAQTVELDMEQMRRQVKETWNVTYHDATAVSMFEDVAVIGCNGWYDFNYFGYMKDVERQTSKRMMNDFRLIDFGDWESPEFIAWEHIHRLRKLVVKLTKDKSVRKIVIFTHTVPHRSGVVGCAHPWAQTNGSFYNSMMQDIVAIDINDKIAVWCFGHTHMIYDFNVDYVRYMCYPVGYPNEMTGFYKHLVADGPMIFEV